MKYYIYAKLLGSYMPNEKARIGECLIMKSYEQHLWDDDRPVVPIRAKDSEFHCVKQGVNNYLYYPQDPISTRTFESEYVITTEVTTTSVREALNEATERFTDVSSALALVAKNKQVRVRNRRIKRGDEFYDFEVFGVFIKRNYRLIRLKLPSPLVSGRNFFPKQFPKGFLAQAKKYLDSRNTVFKKGLIYFQRATAMKNSGVFNELEIMMNFVKCIELICWEVSKDDRFGLTRKEFEKLFTKDVIELAGKKLRVTRKNINAAKRFWDIRNKADIAHKYPYFNPYNRKISPALVNQIDLESTASSFLVKYYKYRA